MSSKEQEIRHEVEKIKHFINSEDSLSITTESSIGMSNYPLIVYGLSKIYDGADPSEAEKMIRKKALNNFSIMLEKNEIFGLLG